MQAQADLSDLEKRMLMRILEGTDLSRHVMRTKVYLLLGLGLFVTGGVLVVVRAAAVIHNPTIALGFLVLMGGVMFVLIAFARFGNLRLYRVIGYLWENRRVDVQSE